ncbi:MAG: peroxidase-related enzyme [FCB group bacterium]|nr:peroxidase-related enzyme [FCB group bacterium]
MTHHGAALYRITKDKELVGHLKKDFHSAKINHAEQVMLEYSVKLTSESCSISVEDIKPLREVGFDDEAILDIVQVVAYFNFVNRLACGLGIELEEFYKNGESNGINK